MVGFDVIPAVDVAGGRLARISSGGPASVEAFGGDPLTAAAAFVEAGARWLHVVDVDLAFSGEPANLDVVRRIAALGVRVQASGGIDSAELVDTMLAAGASRAVLGSASLHDRNTVERLLERFGAALAIGLEIDGTDTIRPRGRHIAPLDLGGTIAWLSAGEVDRFVVTATERADGPDLGTIELVARETGRPAIAAGGIGSVLLLRAAAALPGVEGAIVGRALYEGTLDLGAAISELQRGG